MQSAHIKLLITCCQQNLSADNIKYIRKFISETGAMHLSTLVNLAHVHGIFPLFYRTLQKHAFDLIPNVIVEELKLKNLQLIKFNMRMSAELLTIIQLCADHAIPVLAFKGPALAQMAYGDITLRQYNDLDIFVEHKYLQQFATLLGQNHFKCSVAKEYLANQAFLHVKSDCLFRHTNQKILLEVHWTVFRNSYSSKMKQIDLWKNCHQVTLQNSNVPTFNTEVLLLYLCMHGSKHIWHRIEWIADVDRLITSQANLQWDSIYQSAKAVDAGIMLNLGLSLAMQLFNTKLPLSIQSRINTDKRTGKLTKKVVWMLNEQLHLKDTELKNNYRHVMFHIALSDKWQNKAAILLKNLLPITARDIQAINLPRQFYFLYYVIRPVRLLNKYLQKLFR